jgi:NAD-dependent histone deacetylase SIR2
MEAVQPAVSERSPTHDKQSPSLTTASANAPDVKHEGEDHDPWDDSNSLYEEFLDDSEAFDYSSGISLSFFNEEAILLTVPPSGHEEFCTPQEAKRYRERLHELGLEAFVEETLVPGEVSVRKLCTAFGARIPAWLQGEPDSQCYR